MRKSASLPANNKLVVFLIALVLYPFVLTLFFLFVDCLNSGGISCAVDITNKTLLYPYHVSTILLHQYDLFYPNVGYAEFGLSYPIFSLPLFILALCGFFFFWAVVKKCINTFLPRLLTKSIQAKKSAR